MKGQCRQWQSIVDYSIARKSNFDLGRYELKIEADPFFFSGVHNPTKIPTESAEINTKNEWTIVDPESSPSVVPMTMAPSILDTEQSDGCDHGLKPFEIHLMDTWGDGWDQTFITITGMSDLDVMASFYENTQGGISISKTIEIESSNSLSSGLQQTFQGTLQDGYDDFANVCFASNHCYEIIATGSEFAEEITWEIRKRGNDMEPILTGGAPARCTFSIPDANGHHICPTICSDPVTEAPVVNEIFQPFEVEIAEAIEETKTFTPTEVQAVSDAFLSSLLARAGGYGGSSASSLLDNLKQDETDIPVGAIEQVETNEEVNTDEQANTDE